MTAKIADISVWLAISVRLSSVLLLWWLRDNEPEKYRVVVECGALFTDRWRKARADDPAGITRAWTNIMADSEIGQVVTFLSKIGNLPPPIQQELHRPEGKQ
jgi:hypothetical protein